MASTPDTLGNAGPAGVVQLPLKKALSLLSRTHPSPAPTPALVPALASAHTLVAASLPAQDQHPLASPRRSSGIVYKSRDDDSNLFQLAATIVLPDEMANDNHDIHDNIHDLLDIDGVHDNHDNHDTVDNIHDNDAMHDMQDIPDNHYTQATTCILSEGTALEVGAELEVEKGVEEGSEQQIENGEEKWAEQVIEKGTGGKVEKGAEGMVDEGAEKGAEGEKGEEQGAKEEVEEDDKFQRGCESSNASPTSDLAHPTASNNPQSSEDAHNYKIEPFTADDNVNPVNVIVVNDDGTEPVIAVASHEGDGQAHGTEDAVCLQSRRDSGIPLPVPRAKTLIKCPSADKPLDSVTGAGPDNMTSSTQNVSGKIDILRATRRTPGSGTASASEGSRSSTPSSNVTPHNGIASSYSGADYAEYTQGKPSHQHVLHHSVSCAVLYQAAHTNDCNCSDNLDGLGHGTYFADDNPTSQSASMRDSGRLCDFSGPLGEKIKESILEHMALESMDSCVEQVTALEGEEAVPGTPRSSLGSPSAVPKALSKTCPVVLSSPAPKSNPLSVSMAAVCSRTSGLSPPSSPTFSSPPERKRRSLSSAVSSPSGGRHTAPSPAKPILPPPTPPSPILSSPISLSPTSPPPVRSSTKPPSPTPPSLNLSSPSRSSLSPPLPTPPSVNLPLPARSSPTPPSLNISSPTPSLAIRPSPVSRSPTQPSPNPLSPVRTHVSPSHVPRTPTPPSLVLPSPILSSSIPRSPTPPSPIAHYSQESSPSKKTLPTSATSFSIISASNGTMNGSPKGTAVAVVRELPVAAHTALESAVTTLEKVRIISLFDVVN